MEKGEPVLILLIEDDPAHAEIAIRNFRKSRLGNKVIHLADGQQALDYLFRQGEFTNPETSPIPDLILLDLRLPKVDGLEVLQRVKSKDDLRCIPIIVLTTSEADADIAKAYKFNVNSYLVKPLDFSKFSEMIESFGFYWIIWNKYPPCNG